MDITYLAIPYSHEDKRIEEMRFEIANFVASTLMKTGEIIFSPISHTHPMVRYGLPGDWEYWKSQDRSFLDVCSRFKVVCIEGWDKSSGVSGETKHMEERGINAEYVDPYELEGFAEFMEEMMNKLSSRYLPMGFIENIDIQGMVKRLGKGVN
jgi:hypothetical protein